MVKYRIQRYAQSAQKNISWFNLDDVWNPMESVVPKIRSGFWTVSDSLTNILKTYLGSMLSVQHLGGDYDYTCLVTRRNYAELLDTDSIWENLIDWCCNEELSVDDSITVNIVTDGIFDYNFFKDYNKMIIKPVEMSMHLGKECIFKVDGEIVDLYSIATSIDKNKKI